MHQTKQILQLHFQGRSGRWIAKMLGVSRNTVKADLDALAGHPLDPEVMEAMSATAVYQHLHPDNKASGRVMPNMEYVHTELRRHGVTLQLLWAEYAAQCEEDGTRPYQYSRFCDLYRSYVAAKGLTAPLVHKAGEEVMVDWAGKTVWRLDPETGKKKKTYVFVGVLPYSMYIFAQACSSMEESSWIDAHVNMFEFFGGVPRILTSDNTKTAVIHNRVREDPLLNRAYKEFADFYGVALLPARVLAPQDKAAVESSVNTVTQRIIAPLRNTVFQSVEAANDAVRDLADEINRRPFQKRSGSREQVFREDEASLLSRLPDTAFDLPLWKKASVQANCHVEVDRHYYSVPHENVGKVADVRIARDEVAVYIDDELICRHVRQLDPKCRYVTNTEHLPDGHQKYRDWNAGRFLQWAESIGPSCAQVVRAVLDSYTIEQQAYKTLFGILHLPKSFPLGNLNSACGKALATSSRPRLKQIESIMREQTRDVQIAMITQQKSSSAFELTRGSSYYGSSSGEDSSND